MRIACTGKIVMVAGGTRGIGRAASLSLAEAGATVIVTGRTTEAAQIIAGEIAAQGGTAHAMALDVGEPEASARVVGEIVARFGRLDGLVANAGINPYWKRTEALTPSMWDEVMAVNLRGIFFLVQAAGQQMLKQQSGSIVAVSSVTAEVGVPRGLPYVATKGGLDAMVRSAAVEWADRKVRVNAVAPGYVATDLTHGLADNPSLGEAMRKWIPMGRFGEADEIAGAIVFLASDAASYVTGQILTIDGGLGAGRTLNREN